MVRNVIQALVILILFAGPAAAQSIPMGSRSASPEQIEKEKREESAANRALSKIPDKEKKSKDPWGNVRSAPQAPGTDKKPRQ